MTEQAADGLYEQLRENWYVEGATQHVESEAFRDREPAPAARDNLSRNSQRRRESCARPSVVR